MYLPRLRGGSTLSRELGAGLQEPAHLPAAPAPPCTEASCSASPRGTTFDQRSRPRPGRGMKHAWSVPGAGPLSFILPRSPDKAPASPRESLAPPGLCPHAGQRHVLCCRPLGAGEPGGSRNTLGRFPISSAKVGICGHRACKSRSESPGSGGQQTPEPCPVPTVQADPGCHSRPHREESPAQVWVIRGTWRVAGGPQWPQGVQPLSLGVPRSLQVRPTFFPPGSKQVRADCASKALEVPWLW